MDWLIRILGCGSSQGVPLSNNTWGDADPQDPRNRRSRSSLWIRKGQESCLIDPGPDFRQQALNNRIQKISRVLVTHGHRDHIGGIPDLLPFAQQQGSVIPFYGDQGTLDTIRGLYSYFCIPGYSPPQGPLPDLSHPFFIALCPLEMGPLDLASDPVEWFIQPHGKTYSLGFRFPNWAYSTDLSDLTPAMVPHLQGLDLWILACTYVQRPSSAHGNLAKILQWINRIRPNRGITTHMGTEVDYENLSKQLPPQWVPGFDGLETRA